MKRYYRYPGTRDADGRLEAIQVGLDVVVGDAVMALVESGIDEDAHHWDSAWRDVDDDDLEFFLKMPEAQARMIEYIRLPLIEKLREVLASRRAEQARHMATHHDGQVKCECICHEQGRVILHDHACCTKCDACGFRAKCTCQHCMPVTK